MQGIAFVNPLHNVMSQVKDREVGALRHPFPTNVEAIFNY